MQKTTGSGDEAKRPRRSRAEWRAEIVRWKQSGLSAGAYATRHNLSRSTLFWWSTHLQLTPTATTRAETPSFLPLRIAPAVSAEATPFALEVTLRNGRTVRARGDVDAARFARVLDALEGGGE